MLTRLCFVRRAILNHRSLLQCMRCATHASSMLIAHKSSAFGNPDPSGSLARYGTYRPQGGGLGLDRSSHVPSNPEPEIRSVPAYAGTVRPE
eukprot:2027974-Karenia_brevis.AAC.1